MVAVIIKGNEVAEKKRAQLKEEVVKLKEQGIVPGLAVILVGEDPASRSYVKGKEKGCEQVGIYSELIEFPETITEERLVAEIDRLNGDDRINGILVQLPLPKHIEEKAIIERISPEKDVDGFHPISVGRMMTGQDTFLPCTPHGIVELVKETNLDISGKHVVVIGRSNIVGKPVGQLFLNENATVTYCHSKTQNMKELTKLADILIVAVGRPKMVTADYIKEGAVVIDVGVNRLETGKLCGDVDFDNVLDVAGYITPVPKGVGPMTITMLLHNTVESAKRAGVVCK
ncbi:MULTISPECIES: bifunctional methylenetetrahydrofolate dehydrogenase/methenyltetrahydrofolate cyclohydrolase FolD [Bacillus cereus group]|jgi:methylenetetrahydrofolate dehydrogenase (NADP+)/methenyltetrahydrofolate cyclohydrolase|uniref:bifunctional methylenetetrahydrofolate dehydrogenase/methenyltetrahydrofolate cyclohydrolase FolD n=1 Tax=Bacillus cereus group TaxID=86661 RepID=UPI000C329FAF|nr:MULTISPECIES: bifunctional methylenetetrahydrofolate dehydrogenase/methenyltetrahydrofolate cyclohydrolase FolD [Bacillus cereus group]AUD22341.1 bifunctional methylenetetrahydrofolate dehydrogenase/methenyltetrahydrofolate cyclohydrolase FolD [Bacillus sp. HBCD-sjtu]MDH7997974.1 bifunctional methylenetetrahydrofolate dehydrogenase/methenyltetrahydrofolate cyclohydrolase FolD [Bacillus cereus]NKW85167.1 bifunctional methylenetetrahydrofolate dehydrogenase/methenyltetrahydrofolate cyclohydrola